MTLVYLLLGLCPSFLQRWIRNLMGAHIQPGARLGMFSLIAVRDLRMAPGARIGAFVVMRVDTVAMERNARIRPLSMFKVRHLSMGRDSLFDPMVLVNCDRGPRSSLVLGRSVRVFSFSVLEPSEGIEIGDHTGIGGQCLIFCHGSWPNYLEGAPYSRGPVRLGRGVWIPWRVMILPNVEIGDHAIIGAHSLVRSDVPSRALFSGVPARLVVDEVWLPTDDVEEKVRRLEEAVESFHVFHEDRYRGRVDVRALDAETGGGGFDETVVYSFTALNAAQVAAATEGEGVTVMDLDTLRMAGAQGPLAALLAGHLATFGVRISPMGKDETWA